MKILIIGGQGFIGSHLISKLSDHDIEHLDTRVDKLSREYDLVIYLASETVPSSPVSDFRKEHLHLEIFFRFLQQTSFSRLLFISSGGAIYESSNYPHTENDLLFPNNLYAFSKIQMENMVRLLSASRKYKYTILRPSNIYGIGKVKRSQGFIQNLFYLLSKNSPIQVWGDGEDVRDYLYVDDFIEAVRSLIEREFTNQTYNISSQVGHTVNDVIEIAKNITMQDIRIERVQSSTNIRCNLLDSSKIRSFLSWEPMITLENGMEKIWKKYE